MELDRALQTTGAVREFSSDPVPDDVVYRLLDLARFAPSGGNRQAWRVILVKDAEGPACACATSTCEAGTSTWRSAPPVWCRGRRVTDRDAEQAALRDAERFAAEAARGPGGFAEHLDRAPVILVLLADLRALAAVDRDLDRYTLVGGASIYPLAWSILLAAHGAGLGGVITTMLVRSEDEVRQLLGVPADWAVAGALALGYPAGGKRPTRLRRTPVEGFTAVDRFDGPPLEA